MKKQFTWLFIVALVSCSKMQDTVTDPLNLEFANDTYQLTGVAVAPGGRLFTNYPRWSDIYRYAVTEVGHSYQEQPYPSLAMNSWNRTSDPGANWVCVQAVYADERGHLWVVDPASPKMQGVVGAANKLVNINLTTNTIERTYHLNSVAGPNSYLNDVRVDNERGYAYLTNSQEGGIVVVNLSTGAARQVLQNHYSLHSDPNYQFVIDGKELRKNGQVVKIHSDGIALTPDRQWLYYKPLTDDKLYRVRTEYLQNELLSATDLESKVEDLGHFTATDGMIFDSNGNLYLGDIQHSRIMKVSPLLQMTEWLKDSRLIWPDSYSIANGYMYISCSQISRQPEYNEGVNKRTTPYAIYRVRL